jgi:hypothetical protein
LVDSDIGVNTKGAGSSTPHTIIGRTTIAGVNFGIVAQDKDAPDPNVVITYDVTSSIIHVNPGGDPVSTDYNPADIRVAYSNVGESWPGAGNINQDPMFNDASAGDFRLRPGPQSVDAGDPAAAQEADGTRVDQGFYGNGISGTLAPTTISAGTIRTNLILVPFGGPYRVAGNVFANVSKDDDTSDRRYANAISTGTWHHPAQSPWRATSFGTSITPFTCDATRRRSSRTIRS